MVQAYGKLRKFEGAKAPPSLHQEKTLEKDTRAHAAAEAVAPGCVPRSQDVRPVASQLSASRASSTVRRVASYAS